jgi:drug/metabolite transporter (DMT)-like permease
MKILGPLLLALLAAVGNGFFAFGQRKAVGVENTFVFITLTLSLCVVLCILAAPFFGNVNYLATLRNNTMWAVISGIGLFMTYIGFNLLYANYGASGYTLYGVLSILTTSVIVGSFLLKEPLNVWHWMGILAAIATVALFSYGNSLR